MSTLLEERVATSVAKVIEITSESTESFEDAVRRAIVKAAETVHDIRSAGSRASRSRSKAARSPPTASTSRSRSSSTKRAGGSSNVGAACPHSFRRAMRR